MNRIEWNADEVPADVREYVGEHLGDPEAVLILGYIDFLKKASLSCYGCTRPSRTATSAACVREVRSNFVRSLLTWVRAVRSLIRSSSAMAWFERPWATSTRTARSRGLREAIPLAGVTSR